jgi:NAD(P) transhydrogenase subunit beta
MSNNLVALLYLAAGVLFVLALRGLSSPETSRRGNYLGMAGMTIAVVTTLAVARPSDATTWAMILGGIAIGGSIGAVIARRIPMTAMPELVAAFHSLVGMAAVLVAAAAFYAPEAFGIGTPGDIRTQSLIEMSLGVAIVPVLQVWKAGTVLFNKRSLASGYAGIDNPLFYRDNMMVLGDAKRMTEEIAKAF